MEATPDSRQSRSGTSRLSSMIKSSCPPEAPPTECHKRIRIQLRASSSLITSMRKRRASIVQLDLLLILRSSDHNRNKISSSKKKCKNKRLLLTVKMAPYFVLRKSNPSRILWKTQTKGSPIRKKPGCQTNELVP